jgi:DNA-binding LytR/AlgR family response regulator
MKIKSIIVEDEPLSLNFLQQYCVKSGMIELLGTFCNAELALDFLRTTEVELIFLDVEMPGINGFQLLDQLMYMPKIILTTSKTEYAFTAFQYQVTDYLKKPIVYSRFTDSVNRVASAITRTDKETEKSEPEDVFIKSNGKLIRLTFNDILFIESEGDYVKYVTTAKKYIAHATLKSIEERIDHRIFLKVHRCYIVNTKKIQDIQDNSLLIEGNVIPISKAHKDEVIQRLNII